MLRRLATFLVALSKKGETAKEVAAIASVMTSHAVALDVPAGPLFRQLRNGR